MAKTLPRDLTSYDCLKSLAVVTMLADHVGYYFMPHDLWWRAVGRLSAPVWLFLIGYARSRDLSPRLWLGMGLLTFMNIVAGMALVPLNVLATIIAIRLLLDPLMALMRRGRAWLAATGIALTVLIVPSGVICEYGTQGLILALFGYAARRRSDLPQDKDNEKLANGFFVFSLVSYIFFQQIDFAFSSAQFLAMAAGCVATFVLLYAFRPATYPQLALKLPRLATAALQIMGRYTLEIYVAHLTLFKLLGLWLEPARFRVFHWSWLYFD